MRAQRRPDGAECPRRPHAAQAKRRVPARRGGATLRIVTELIGWASSAILLATLVRQVRKQWREGTSEGVSRWLFVGQTAASAGFTA